ncbi:hypothetical protein [Nakamurella multipartita]|uniref:hypothetical protein n=1 Tax=Nakamurella multipartita TaxID=53461 RepID=UPI0002E03226|nr:hypothetical protein [Nakamurella multipartita]
MPLPVGLVDDPARKVVLDPDTGVQDALRYVVTVFGRTGAARPPWPSSTPADYCSRSGCTAAPARASCWG